MRPENKLLAIAVAVIVAFIIGLLAQSCAHAAPLKIEGLHALTSTETLLRVCVEVSGTEDGQWYQFERRLDPGPWEDFYHPWPGFTTFPIMTYCMDDDVRPFAMFRLKKTDTPLAPFFPLLEVLGVPVAAAAPQQPASPAAAE